MTAPPSPRPCKSCPYRRDVPSGIWAPSEYAKLAEYDRDTAEQPMGAFLCHQVDQGSPAARVCAGWAGTHDTHQLLALRIAVSFGQLTDEVVDAIHAYESPVPLFDSGAEAAEHGMRDIDNPSDLAKLYMLGITRLRADLTYRYADDGTEIED